MTQDAAFDDAPDPRLDARVSSGVGTMLGIAVALLIALLPGGSATGARQPSAFSGAAADQSILAAANRLGDARTSLFKARGPNQRRPDFDNTPVLLVGALALALVAMAGLSLRPPLARAQTPARWPSTTRARAPPRA